MRKYTDQDYKEVLERIDNGTYDITEKMFIRQKLYFKDIGFNSYAEYDIAHQYDTKPKL